MNYGFLLYAYILSVSRDLYSLKTCSIKYFWLCIYILQVHICTHDYKRDNTINKQNISFIIISYHTLANRFTKRKTNKIEALAKIYLNTCFRERYPKRDFFSEKNVGIMRFLEERFQFLKLLRRECCPIASLLEKVNENPTITHVHRRSCKRAYAM